MAFRFVTSIKAFIGLSFAMAFLPGCMNMLPVLAPPAKDAEKNISTAFPYESHYVSVLGSRMHYIEQGHGQPILLLHGNPTSSYIWRNVIPILSKQGRVIAPDLIGMGKSDRPDLPYTLQDHIRYVDAFIAAMDLKNVVLVGHDWGGGIAFDYAARNPGNVRGIAFFEAIIRPMTWDEINPIGRYIFQNFRKPDYGRQLIVDENYFIEKLLPMMTGRKMAPVEMDAYRKPFPTPASRKLVYQWPQELPIDGVPERNCTQMARSFETIRDSRTPLLFLHGEPGAFFQKPNVEKLKRDLPRAQVVFTGGGYHFLSETQPTNIGNAVAKWISELK